MESLHVTESAEVVEAAASRNPSRIPRVSNVMQALILGELRRGVSSGAEILRSVQEVQGMWTCTRSQVYREIQVLRTAGLIKPIGASDDAAKGGSAPELYQISRIGRQAYVGWVDTVELGETIRNSWVLRLHLCNDNAERAAVCEAAIDWHSRQSRVEPPSLTEGLMIKHHKMMREWFALQLRLSVTLEP